MFEVFRKLFDLFDRHERHKFYILVFLMVLVGISELVGISSVMVLLKVLTGAEAMVEQDTGAWLYNSLGFENIKVFQAFTAASVVIVYCLALVVRAGGTYAIAQFSNMRGYTISVKLLRVYLHRPYTWFLQRNTSEIRKMVLTEVDRLVARVMIPSLMIISNLIVTIVILGFLLALNPVVSILALVFLGGSYALIYLRLRRPLHRLGREFLDVNAERFRLAEEATGGFKEVKLKGVENLLANRFCGPARRFAQLGALQQILLALPRFALEGLSFFGMVALIFVFYRQSSGDLEVLFPTLGVFAFSIMRLLPALQQAFQGFASIRNGKALLDRIHFELSQDTGGTPAYGCSSLPLELHESIKVKNIGYGYEGAERSALHDVTLEIPAYKTIALVGGTGAGKTTLVDIILGLLPPGSGELQIDGQTLTAENRRSWQSRIGYVPQSIYLTDDTIANNIAFGEPDERVDGSAVERAARMASLHDFIEQELPRGYDTMVGERGVRLSGGQRQRIGIARALYSDPDLLVMDEATSALDTLTERAVMEAVRNVQGQKTIILIAHRLSTVRNVDCIYLMDGGRITASGTYDDLLGKSDLFRKMASDA